MTPSQMTPPAAVGVNVRAIIAMVASMFVFSVSDVAMKLVGSQMPVGQMLLVRGLISSVLLLLLAWATGAMGHVHRMLEPKVVWRSLAEALCSVLYFLALMRMTLADVAAINQFAPLLVMVGAAVLFAEPVGWRRWSAAGVGFLGVLLIVKPGTSAFQPASLLMLASAFLVAVRDLVTRRIQPGIPTVLVTAAAVIAVTLTGGLMTPFETWHTPSRLEWLMLSGSGVAVIAGFMFAIEAMRVGDIAVVTPFRYTFMVFATLLSFVVFGDVPDGLEWIGIALIVASGLYTLHRQRVRRAAAGAAATTGARRA
jgi:drug/metabolite transporter (DMT)-like permease